MVAWTDSCFEIESVSSVVNLITVIVFCLGRFHLWCQSVLVQLASMTEVPVAIVGPQAIFMFI